MSARVCVCLAAVLGLAACTNRLPGRDAGMLPTATVREVADSAADVAASGEGASPDRSASPLGGQTAPDRLEQIPGQVLLTLAPGAEVPLDLGSGRRGTVAGRLEFGQSVVLMELPEGLTPDHAVQILRDRPGVVGASPNRRLKPHANPPANDPFLPMQWPYGPDRADVYGGWAELDQLDAVKIASTTVAIIDTGTDPGHEDLYVLPGYSATIAPKNGVVSTASFDPGENDHGTAVAGVVAALKGNGKGAAGVAPGVAILPLRVFGRESYAGTDYAILYALKIAGYYNRAGSPWTNLSNPSAGPVRVVNMSLGGFGARLAAYEAAMEFLRGRGIVVVASAGNGGGDGLVEAPANSLGAIAVSVTMDYLGFEILAPYSSFGQELWVAAPGNYIWSTGKLNTYHLFNGTSSAAPFVAGVAALINAKYGSGGAAQLTAAWADRVRKRLADSADDLGPPGWDPQYGWGRVNAKKAVTGTLP